LTLSEVTAIRGETGNFEVEILKHPRYVDMDKCIACGICAEKCPKKIDDLFNEGLIKRKSIYVEYAQAVPLKYAIDSDSCIHFQKGKCKACEKFCPADAVNFEEKEEKLTLNVGSVILAPGFEAFDPRQFDTYKHAAYPNVVTSMEFERILSATGPYQGHLIRPSDQKKPQKIAFLQCVGSRDINRCDNAYCSSVCCVYAIKEAMIAKEHAGGDLETAVFFMDMRTHGKDFDRYYNRAKDEVGVRFVRSRVHTVETAGPGSDDLRIVYVDEKGEQHSEIFSLVVLSTGMEISREVRGLAQRLDIELDKDGFASSSCFSPVATSRPGIFACGAFAGPKDIPQSVMEASAAASASAALLSGLRNTLTREKTYPPEDPVCYEEPRIGVFVCHCGINIGGIVDVPAVRDYARTLPNVVYAKDNLFSCSQDTQETIRKAIKENRLNRVVMAAGSPLTHEPLFQATVREAGLNPYLFEFANIRNQDSWVHQNEPEKATQKAKDLVRMAVSKAAFLEPIERLRLDINQHALVIGGGIAGMNAALSLADQGYQTYLVEKSENLGGHGLTLKKTWKDENIPEYLSDLSEKINGHARIEVLLNTEISNVTGFIGNFNTTVRSEGSERELAHGVIILATGGAHLVPDEYLYGRSERVTLWHELEDLFESLPETLEQTEDVAFIQCVGSREPDRPYCSKVCCTSSIQQAIDLKTRKPDLNVYILYRDIRTYGQRENLYRKARELGVIFIRFSLDEKPVVEKATIDGKEKLKITVKDHVLGIPVQLHVDYLNLATAIVPKGQEALAKMLKVSLNEDGFFLEAHVKLRPVDFATDGVFVCGLAHYPKPIEESIAQAQAAASRAASILAKDSVEMAPIVSEVDRDKCIGCGLCEASCPFGAIQLIKVTGRGYKAENIQALCKGCGVCAAACPQHAIDMKHFRDQQILAAIEAGGAKG
jgi:heterodisulfide reductase subunit A